MDEYFGYARQLTSTKSPVRSFISNNPTITRFFEFAGVHLYHFMILDELLYENNVFTYEKNNFKYFVSTLLQFQLYRSMCRAAGQYDQNNPSYPLHKCDIYRSKEAGKILKQLMEKGSSLSWRETLFQATGESRLDGSAMRDYFRPLEEWLRSENLRTQEYVGWVYDGDYCKQSIETAGLQVYGGFYNTSKSNFSSMFLVIVLIDTSIDLVDCSTGMLIRLWILKIIIDVALCELTGDNICEVEESYPVNVTEYSWRNATVRNYKWCMGFPPRCSFYTFKRVRVPNVVEKNETRIVKKCCTGYAVNSKHDGCVQCKKCHYGTCGEEGKCICNAGFKGDQCGEACEATRWGIDCQFQCLCEKGNCDPRSGRCDCPSGWFGTRCELLCLEGFYGKHCMHRCNCGERELCSSQTGECATRSTHRQEHQSTRAIHYLTEDILNFTRMIDKQKSTPSLKKYHTFDMELNTNKPFHPKITTNQIINVNENWKPNSSNTTESNISKFKDTKSKTTKQLTTIKKKNYELNRKISETNTNDDYIDSTTEASAEIEHSIEHLPMLNENESLEGKDSIELTKNIQRQQNKNDNSKIVNGVIQLATKESRSSVTSRNEENASKNTQSNDKKYKEKENSKNLNQNWKKLEKTTVSNSKVKNYT
ncbi:hypothetical protein WA026_014350 [Henosepilachna vigintioctopunctata]|uniref:EMI domain-containing protein n=1 Tax=Henosepilachna vigintioctopunctata TaxID=420089 RepID=A0AAW1UBA6_9CUCU